eukprot:1143203-Pelagomonas_calceolata.AAC.3
MCTSAYGWPENRVRNTGASLRTVGPNRVWPQVLPGHECCTCCLLLEGCEHAHRVVATESKRVGDTSSDLQPRTVDKRSRREKEGIERAQRCGHQNQ